MYFLFFVVVGHNRKCFFFFGGGGGWWGLFTVGQTTKLNPTINFNDLLPAGCWLVVWLQFGSFSSLLWLVQLMIFSPPSPNRTVPNPIFDLRYFWGWNWLCERLTDKHHAGAVYYHHLVFSTALSLLSFKIRILCVLWSMSLLFFFQEFFFF